MEASNQPTPASARVRSASLPRGRRAISCISRLTATGRVSTPYYANATLIFSSSSSRVAYSRPKAASTSASGDGGAPAAGVAEFSRPSYQTWMGGPRVGSSDMPACDAMTLA